MCIVYFRYVSHICLHFLFNEIYNCFETFRVTLIKTLHPSTALLPKLNLKLYLEVPTYSKKPEIHIQRFLQIDKTEVPKTEGYLKNKEPANIGPKKIWPQTHSKAHCKVVELG